MLPRREAQLRRYALVYLGKAVVAVSDQVPGKRSAMKSAMYDRPRIALRDVRRAQAALKHAEDLLEEWLCVREMA